jgi:hypothetical protein
MGRSTARLLVAGTLAVACGAPRVSAADDGKVRCAAAYEHAQEQRRGSRLAEARRELLVCEQTCPAVLTADCTRWRTEVEALMPTVRLRATDAAGQAVDAQVMFDGAPLVDHIGRDAIPVDSGDHTFRFVTASGQTVDVKASLHAGERDRAIDAALVPRAPATTPSATPASAPQATEASTAPGADSASASTSTGGSIPLGALVLGGIGGVGLGVGGVLSLIGHSNASQLSATCAPRCDPRDVDAIQTKYTAAWISGGAGLAALVTAVVVWHPWQKQRPTETSGFFVAPAGGGAIVIAGWRSED